MSRPDFPLLPPGFRFGAATAAYQIEGAHAEDGRGPSIWDTFSHTPGRTLGGATGDTAADHYHRYREDIALLRDLGVDSYRFSISWPRVLPEGTGRANAKGLDFYDRLIDELLAAGIAPAVTLYHWDLPQALEDHGGWRVRDTAAAFADYAALAAERYGDRVRRWITLNEPYCTAFVGHAEGRHAPGTREGRGALAAAHHLLVAHGLAVRALRAAGAEEVGITLNLDRVHAASDHPDDLAALRRAETLHNDIWAEPLFAGRYPEHEAETWAGLADGPWRRPDDLTVIGTPLDFVGLNYYRPICVTAAPHRAADPEQRTAVDIGVAETDPYGTRHTTMGWPVVPSAFTELLRRLHDRYPRLPPIWITENGSAEADTLTPDGQVHDDDRTRYLADHLQAVADAIAAGVDVRGHYVWSLLDNFEWARGYDQRFGLVRVDYDTQTRTPKDSYRWFRDLITGHRARTKDAR
ncbi:GH1 family beta-glucosidase [Streptomyces turgidiscabies]|uniref:Beta-glucosidase n=2 Tax=Streptomyces TaxID=1883 RepID=L7F5W9_STRT8|nr:GH1 family beta-glucosidase [Streptomyces turgidiscabies]ELP66519.1 beta-galactosidase [Streptomyces turgidiscabies Car8]MDX3494828.1 GH1 family beta-glucosidase [Streptomyces turgidiscabies]GAQ71437.1 beta-glucosidase [Streptomyces turgidiscabies]